MAGKPDLSIIIPCYNEEGHLESSVNRICETFDDSKFSYELIFVDDCSKDNTRAIIEKVCREKGNRRFLMHAANTGRGGAVLDGIKLAQGKYAGFIDIDLEVAPIHLLAMMVEIEKGADLCIGARVYKLSFGFSALLRWILSRGYSHLVRFVFHVPEYDTESGIKIFRMDTMRDVIGKVENRHWFFDTELVLRTAAAGRKIVQVPVLFIRNKDKKSTVRLGRDVVQYLRDMHAYWKSKRNPDKPAESI